MRIYSTDDVKSYESKDANEARNEKVKVIKHLVPDFVEHGRTDAYIDSYYSNLFPGKSEAYIQSFLNTIKE